MRLAIGVVAMAVLAAPAVASACDIGKDDRIALWGGVADMPTDRTQALEPAINPQSYSPGERLPKDCRIKWKADKPYARIKKGQLTIAPGAPDGDILTVTGELQTSGGKRKVEGKLYVFDRSKHAAVGNWRQTAINCPGGEGPGEPMNELILDARGGFKATWTPFETYVDYWGTYSYDLKTGALVLKPTGGNHVPQDAVLEGTAALADKELKTKGVSFGQPMGPALPAACEITFRRG